jgi:hypothetical protein
MTRRRPLTLLVVALAALTVMLALPGCSLFSQKTEVLFIGDSIMNQTGPFVTGQLSAQPGVGPVDTKVLAKNGTGLLTPELYDWVGKAPGLIDSYDPKIVVVNFVGNYTGAKDGEPPLWTTADGREVTAYTPDFFTEWGAQADKLTTELQAKGAKVFWVLPIPLPGDDGKQREDALRSTYEELAQRRPDVGLIDGRVALGGPDGEWVWSRPNIDNTDATVRLGDALHVTQDGGALLARQMAEAVAPALLDARSK